MRPILAFLMLFLASCSTTHEVTGTYYSDNQDCLSLGRGSDLIEAKEEGILRGYMVKQSKHKLKFYSAHRRALTFTKRYNKYYFRWIERKADTVVIAPISKKAKSFFQGKQSILFTTKDHFRDQTNYFHTIVFHSSRCFGLCDDLHLQLDYSGNLKVTNNGNGRTDSTRNDNYFGKVSFQDLDKLRILLEDQD